MLLAMAGIESGFNPDAAAGKTSACGLGQFVTNTGEAYGLTPETRFEIGPSVKALIEYFKWNENYAKKKKKPDHWVYKYHHDGTKYERGGTKIANEIFLPLVNIYEKALAAGHVVDVIDPHGQPVADAHVKVEQNGNASVLKTDHNGRLPTFLASPDFGPIKLSIKKIDDSFKHLGELAIKQVATAWTIVAPKDRKVVKTHLHEPPKHTVSHSTDTHKVRDGETVSRIAFNHGTTYQELCKLNGIKKPYTIYPGQILKIPPKKRGHDDHGDGGHPSGTGHKAPSGSSAQASSAAPAAPRSTQGTRAATDAIAPRAADTAIQHSAAEPVPAPPAHPVVKEQRHEQNQHPVASVVAPASLNKMEGAIDYALKHAHKKSISRCLKFVKHSLFANKLINPYDACDLAKDYGPYLIKNGFENILETRPGTNIANAPIGAIIVYHPVDKLVYQGKPIAGHIEIKTKVGYVSDYICPGPTYHTDPVKMISPMSYPKETRYKVTGIFVKE